MLGIREFWVYAEHIFDSQMRYIHRGYAYPGRAVHCGRPLSEGVICTDIIVDYIGDPKS